MKACLKTCLIRSEKVGKPECQYTQRFVGNSVYLGDEPMRAL